MRKRDIYLPFCTFIFIVGAFALGAFNRKEIRTPDYYEVNTRSMFKIINGKKVNGCLMRACSIILMQAA